MMKFTTYETTNLTNNKYYIGVHATKNLKDSYLGSGASNNKKPRCPPASVHSPIILTPSGAILPFSTLL